MVALGQCLLELRNASARDFGANKVQGAKFMQPSQGIQSLVGHASILKGQRVELS